MSHPLQRYLMFALTAAGVRAAEAPESVSFSYEGVVHIDRGDVQAMPAPCRDQTVAWICPHGVVVDTGDPIIIFDTSILQQRLALARYDVRRAEAQMRFDNLRLQSELDTLKEERTVLETELAVVQSGLRKVRSVDGDQVALMKAQFEQNEDRTRNLGHEVKKMQTLVELGQLAEDELVTARIGLAKSEYETELSRLQWEQESKLIDPIEVARLELAEREALLKLGRSSKDASNTPDQEKHGIEKRIEALQRQIESQQNQNQAELDRARNDVREVLRDSFDHTPIHFIEIFNADSGNEVLRVDFGPAGGDPARQPPEGFVIDDGSPFSLDRGFGWDRDLRGQVFLRDEGEPLQRGVVLVKERSDWQCLVDPGEYRLRIGVGDEKDWHSPLIRHAGRALLSKRIIDSREIIEETVRVDGDRLVLTIADDLEKVLRSPGNGVANCVPWLTVGDYVRWADWPIAYFSPREKFTIQALVHQDQAGLLEAIPIDEKGLENADHNEDAGVESQSIVTDQAGIDAPGVPPSTRALRIALSRQTLATNEVTARTLGGAEIPCRIQKIDNTPVEMMRGAGVWWWGEEKKGMDLIARQILIVPQTNDVAYNLQLGETVRCTTSLSLREGMLPVPAHLVVEGEAEAHVIEASTGNRRSVEGFRVGSWFVVTAGLDGDTDFAVPGRPDITPGDDRRFEGEVVAGKKMEVGLSYYWGRIKDMVADGSAVEKDQLIITIVNPNLEARREEIKEAKTRARERYLVALETRRVKTVEAQLEHDDKVLEERRARLKLRELEEQDPLQLATAEAKLKQQDLEAEEVRSRYSRYENLPGMAKGMIDSARLKSEKADFEAAKANLDLIAARRQTDRLQIQEAQSEWLDAVDALSGRAGALKILRMEEHVSRLKAEVELQRALQGEWREIVFERSKHIRAPVAGRLFYLTGWNDHTRARTKFKKDFLVWSGAPIAQVLDMSELGMEARLPEKMYQHLDPGSHVIVGFDPIPGVEVDARVDTIGKSFFLPDDQGASDTGHRSSTSLRVFAVKVLFSPPLELAEHLVPGTKGYLRFP